ncbi:hypothetical protein [Shimazuella kribbensis]|uniref:hypothetical protein n=1 Tax=Shimazuella kribbensis TaxID=139808 RepID=UPI00048F4063|nr:hypothetical protein [Shimazuella kribbensis]
MKNNNKFDIRYYVVDVKTKKRVLRESGQTSAGQKTHIITGLYGKYQLRLYCADNYGWDDNSKKCNAAATVYNY